MKKIAIVLGTSSGIGKAVAMTLLSKDYIVYGGSRSESFISHENFIDIEIDITQRDHINNFIEEVKSDTEVVDLLVNAAGVCEMNSFEESSDLELRAHLETNVIGYFNFLKKFEPLILSEETHIINLYSISAKSYYENTIAYSTSEHAKKAMLNVLEKEWKKYDIRFSNFYVGAVDTPMWENFSEEEKEKMLTLSDFLYIFNCVLSAPNSIQFSDLTFHHKETLIS